MHLNGSGLNAQELSGGVSGVRSSELLASALGSELQSQRCKAYSCDRLLRRLRSKAEPLVGSDRSGEAWTQTRSKPGRSLRQIESVSRSNGMFGVNWVVRVRSVR